MSDSGPAAFWARLLTDAGRLAPDSRLLDVGGGSGVLSAAIHALSGAACTVADTVPRGRDVTGVTFVEADAAALPFADASFDAVLFSHTLHHLPDPQAALVEAARVAAPGGRLLVRTATHADLRALPHARFMPRLLDGILASVPDAPHILDWLPRAGWAGAALAPVQTPPEAGMEEYAASVALLAFREWALAPGGGPDPREAARAWAMSTFEVPPPVAETLLTAVLRSGA